MGQQRRLMLPLRTNLLRSPSTSNSSTAAAGDTHDDHDGICCGRRRFGADHDDNVWSSAAILLHTDCARSQSADDEARSLWNYPDCFAIGSWEGFAELERRICRSRQYDRIDRVVASIMISSTPKYYC